MIFLKPTGYIEIPLGMLKDNDNLIILPDTHIIWGYS